MVETVDNKKHFDYLKRKTISVHILKKPRTPRRIKSVQKPTKGLREMIQLRRREMKRQGINVRDASDPKIEIYISPVTKKHLGL